MVDYPKTTAYSLAVAVGLEDRPEDSNILHAIPLNIQLAGLQQDAKRTRIICRQFAAKYLSALVNLYVDDTTRAYSPAVGMFNMTVDSGYYARLRLREDVDPVLQQKVKDLPKIMATRLVEEQDPDILEFEVQGICQCLSSLLVFDIGEGRSMDVALGSPEIRARLLVLMKSWQQKFHQPFSERLFERLGGILEDDEIIILECKEVGKMWYDGSHCAYAGCNVTQDLKRCSRCKVNRYCSPEHQKADWKGHKPDCFPTDY